MPQGVIILVLFTFTLTHTTIILHTIYIALTLDFSSHVAHITHIQLTFSRTHITVKVFATRITPTIDFSLHITHMTHKHCTSSSTHITIILHTETDCILGLRTKLALDVGISFDSPSKCGSQVGPWLPGGNNIGWLWVAALTRCESDAKTIGYIWLPLVKAIAKSDWPGVYRVVPINWVWNSSLIDAKNIFLLISSYSFIFKHKWNAERESKTNSVFCCLLHSSSKNFKYRILSTASAAASILAVLALRATILSSHHIHPITRIVFQLRLNTTITSRTLFLSSFVFIDAFFMISSLNGSLVNGKYVITQDDFLIVYKVALSAHRWCRWRLLRFCCSLPCMKCNTRDKQSADVKQPSSYWSIFLHLYFCHSAILFFNLLSCM